jgi:hypothetical protein
MMMRKNTYKCTDLGRLDYIQYDIHTNYPDHLSHVLLVE